MAAEESYELQTMREGIKAILLGKRALTDWPLKALVPTSGLVKSLYQDDFALFTEAVKTAEKYQQLTIVGNRFRTPEQQTALKYKNKNTLVLLMPEPVNPHDEHAIAALVATGSEQGFTWTHVGYLPAKTAAVLRPLWPVIRGIPVIMQVSMADGMSVRERAGVVKLRAITPEYSDYVRVRELSDYLNDC